MRVVLAPMEGVVDNLMRELLTAQGGYDLCVTEFIRVVEQLLPEKIFYRYCAELNHGCRTQAGTPVRIQLLGQHPQWMAENAVRAIELGSHGLDINFGCPAKQVNKSSGGAACLREPELVYQIVKQVREAVPMEHIVSAKIRLGWEDSNHKLEIADAVQQAGANELTVHGRTKADGYRAAAINWEAISEIRQHVSIPVIANGEIWNHADGQRCLAVTGCDDLMVGRGALNLPNLGEVVKYNKAPMPWADVVILLRNYCQLEIRGDKEKYLPNRIKQWFSYLRKQYPEAAELFTQLRALRQSEEVIKTLNNYQA
ncbi:tRNA dihydrouridine(16) synthase DusC [Moritella sp. 24]|uniref:tRNA dihydrouridine(16) synthase DusC n=1 Tax=Moritella sp. 24 TaxID=2746230 RepID=UPI001BA8A4DB|nr:tRNA dihydrouridine(16) synthase DusC [Moritella sp. 24]QUM77113.1 tRNA dihydrouridine(16) synthase DusC [Moritella sp. 24]